jgi:hypothetical protein
MVSTNRWYSWSAPRILRPHGWHSQTPSLSHWQIARWISSELKGVSGSSGGFTSVAMGARVQDRHSLRCLSVRALGAGGLMAQFYVHVVQSAMVSLLPERNAVRPGCNGALWSRASYPTDNLAATSTRPDEVPGAISRLAVVVAPILHVVPIGGPGAVTERLIGVDGALLIGTVQSRAKEDRAVLDQGIVDVVARPGEGVEGIEIDGGDDGKGDSVQCKMSMTSNG